MYYLDHLPPHFHATYAERDAQISIDDGRILEGSLPRRAERLVREWAASRKRELRDDWERARRRQSLLPIAPLE